LYSIEKTASRPINVEKSEIGQFFGYVMYVSIYGLRSSRMYWISTSRVPVVAETMGLNMWEQIKLGLNFNDNTYLDPADKLYKIRPFCNH
jgi:hypothetical protein